MNAKDSTKRLSDKEILELSKKSFDLKPKKKKNGVATKLFQKFLEKLSNGEILLKKI